MDGASRQANALLQGIADAFGSLIYATDLKGRFIFANHRGRVGCTWAVA